MPSASGTADDAPAEARHRPRISIGPDELETFLIIAELGSFSKAAERLSLAQPSISNRVQRLERTLRTRLFERTNRAAILTADGERLRARIEPIVRSLHAVVEEFCTAAEHRERSVVVATTPMLATVLMPPVIGRFSKANPRIAVELRDRMSVDLASDIRSGRVDFAVTARTGSMEGVTFETIIADPFVVVGPRGHPALRGGLVPVETLTRHAFLLLAAHRKHFEDLAAAAAALGLSLVPMRTVGNVSTLLGLVAEGLGLTMLPTFVMRVGSTIDDTRFDVAAVEGMALTREYGIASLPGHQWSPGARALAASLRAELLGATPNKRPVRPGR